VQEKVAANVMIAEIVETDQIADHVSRIRIKASVSKAKEIVNRIQTKDPANNKAKAIGMHVADATVVDVVDVMVAMKAHKAKIVLNHVMMPAMNQLVQSQ
jgi:DNA-directed RNA polymerase specialized sigma54-like protein